MLTFIAIVAITFLAGKINLSARFNRQVTELFALSKNISGRKFNYAQLAGLREPLQRYFKLVLKDGQPYTSYVSLQHDRQFKTDLKKDWVNITGEQYFTTEKPGFICKGTTAMFIARDIFLADEGRLIATIFSAFNGLIFMVNNNIMKVNYCVGLGKVFGFLHLYCHPKICNGQLLMIREPG